MSCTTRLFGIPIGRHDWQRTFCGTETEVVKDSDMWGRRVNGEYVVCHTRPVCSTCGAVGEPVECICDKSKADCCTFRLEGMNAGGIAAE